MLLRRVCATQATTLKPRARIPNASETADILFLAVPGRERANALKEMGDGLRAKPLVDVTNNLTGPLG